MAKDAKIHAVLSHLAAEIPSLFHVSEIVFRPVFALMPSPIAFAPSSPIFAAKIM